MNVSKHGLPIYEQGPRPQLPRVDGDQLADKLKELRLDLSAEVIEKVRVDEAWFRSI